MSLSSAALRAEPTVFAGFTMLELGMAVIIPASCIAFTLGAFLVNYHQQRDAEIDAEKMGAYEKEVDAVEASGDTIEMFVELELGSPREKKPLKDGWSGEGFEKI
ncbi:hypothetical protein DE146DRAFT_463744 [Phaeosphaeria sp. MPI-PUGE-AT-0046c]|nr:hypothetical protein DE146DRAFT_463744 [Phaeosphaeria sp. MPI-PUGE-AT-0046c]